MREALPPECGLWGVCGILAAYASERLLGRWQGLDRQGLARNDEMMPRRRERFNPKPVTRGRVCRCGAKLPRRWRGDLCSPCMDRRDANENQAADAQRAHLERMGIHRGGIDEHKHIRERK